MKKKEELKKYFFIATIILLLFLAYKIIAPYLITLMTAFILAYLGKPVFNKLNKKFNKQISATICTILLIIIIILPFAFLIGGVINQISYVTTKGTLERVMNDISNLPLIQNLNVDLTQIGKTVLNFLASLLTSIIKTLPSMLVNLLILVIGIYSILLNWNSLSKELERILPLKDKRKTTKEISQTTKAIVYGSILIGFIQLLIALIGFYLSGVGAWMLAAIFIFFLSFFPGIGPAAVWLPLSTYYLLTKNTGTFIGILITGLILSYIIDALLRAKILGKTSGVSPFIMLLGILGGISVFGIFGFIIGPLVLIYSIKIIKQTLKN
jgi:predicted PurR-regulated permease PerM